jgi:hypothetical protein
MRIFSTLTNGIHIEHYERFQATWQLMDPQREKAIRASCFDRIAKHTGLRADAPIRRTGHADAFGSDLSDLGLTSNNHSSEPLDDPAPSRDSPRESSAGSSQAETTQVSQKRYVNASVFIVRFHSRLTSARSRIESQQHRRKRSRKNTISDDEDDTLSPILELEDAQDPSTEEEGSNTD